MTAFQEMLFRRNCFACSYDPRFSYYVYVPEGWKNPEAEPRLLVVIHGGERGAESYRNRLIRFSEETGIFLLVPLFPIRDGLPLASYRTVFADDMDYSAVVLHMVEEFGKTFGVSFPRFFIHGFSAGGQFVQRLLYLCPEHIAAASIGAPSEITLPDVEKSWPEGLGEVFLPEEVPPVLEALKKIPIQIVVGAEDNGSMNGGPPRKEVSRNLAKLYRSLGCDVRLDDKEPVGHNGFPLLPLAEDFFRGLEIS